MDIGELASAAIAEVLKDDCAFCNETEGKKEKLKLEENWRTDTNDPDIADDGDYLQAVNNSGRLASALGAKPKWPIELRSTTPSVLPYIKPGYFIKRSDVVAETVERTQTHYALECTVCPNAHHLIPGNDSMAKSVEINKWLANEVEWKSVSYESDKEKIDKLPGQVLDALNQNRSHTNIKKHADHVETKVRTYTDSGSVKTVKTKHFSGKVTGKVEYDINRQKNGIWLPGNNAVIGWGNADTVFKRDYVMAAITAAGDRQFHDAHKDYSKRVRRELDELGKKIAEMGNKCIIDESHRSQNEPLSAPKQLASVLDKLSGLLAEKLSSPKSKWTVPFLTSERSLCAK